MISFDPFPSLETPRLRLRELVLDDAPAILRIQSDPEVGRYFGRALDHTIEEAERRLARVIAGVREQTSIRWGITLRGSPELLGTAGFWGWNKPHRWAEVGYELRPAHWGQGIMSEALRAICAFGFEAMDLHRVEAQIDPANRASARVLEKVGFAREGLLRGNWHHDGRFTDTAVYGLLQSDLGVRDD